MNGIPPIVPKLEALPKARQVRPGAWVACCPAHEDKNPSLSWSLSDDRVLLKCFASAGCTPEAITAAVGCTLADLFAHTDTPRGLSHRISHANAQTLHGDPLEELVKAKKLDPATLTRRGVKTIRRFGAFALEIAYRDQDGNLRAIRYREPGRQFRWRTGDHVMLYGLERLAEIRRAGWVLLVEGESDVWTADEHGIPALGIPGKSTLSGEWVRHLDGLDVVLWQEPDAADLVTRFGADVPAARIIVAPAGVKDISEAHIAGRDVAALVAELRAVAPSAADLIARRRAEAAQAALPDVTRRARPILDADDPLVLVEQAIAAVGFGGDRRPVVLVYLAATTRVLAYRTGALPAHVLLIGPPAAGKTFVVWTALGLLPTSAVHSMEAGSARTVIYEDADLAHRVLIFPEADSIPAGEDNPAASALRALLTDGRLAYKVVVRDAETGEFTVKDVEKDGPTVLISTSVRRLAPQFDSRVFVLEVPDELAQLRSALDAQAASEVNGIADVPLVDALVAYQELLGARAPWDVVVPFAPGLATAIGRNPVAPRVTRDFGRIVALVKATAIVRHRRRETDERGRLVASIEDYATVRELVADVYEGSSSGASQRTRETVEALAIALRESGDANATASVRDVAQRLPEVTYSAVWRRLQGAIKAGFVLNDETRKGQPAILRLGDPMPTSDALPDPETVCAFASPIRKETPAGVSEILDAIEPDLWTPTGGPALWPPGSATVECSDYHAHQTRHRWTGAAFACPVCHPEAA